MKKIILQLVLILILIAIPLSFASAAGVVLDPSLKPEYATDIQAQGGGRSGTANLIMQLIAGSLIYAAGPLAVLFLAIGGLRYVVSRGDQTQMEEAKKTITYAIAGLIVIVLSWAIVTNIIQIASETDDVPAGTPTTQAPAGGQGGQGDTPQPGNAAQ